MRKQNCQKQKEKQDVVFIQTFPTHRWCRLVVSAMLMNFNIFVFLVRQILEAGPLSVKVS